MPAPSLPPVDDEATVPFSDLFTAGFDPATIDATTQLADRGIFVTSSGRRYRFESIPDDPVPGQDRVPSSAPNPAAVAQPVTQPIALHTPRPTVSISPAFLASTQPPAPTLAPRNAPLWGRSPSNASSYSSGAYSAPSGYAAGGGPGYPEPSAPTHELTGMMAQLGIRHRGFGATPLYGESDGGAHAAETLTDPYLGPRPSVSPVSSDGRSNIPQGIYGQHGQISYTQHQPPHYTSATTAYDYVNRGSAPQHWANINYAGYTTQTNAQLQHDRQRAVATTGLPSLMEASEPMAVPHRASDPMAAFSPIPSYGEIGEGLNPGPEYSYNNTLHHSVSAPVPGLGRNVGQPHPRTYKIDTLTPVVVHDNAPSTMSDGGSTGRDNVLPGEDLLFDGPVKSAQTLTSPVFRDGVLKVFRSTLTNDLRFHCKVDRESETFWMKGDNAQLIPAYAYDPRLPNVVYVRDKESDQGAGYTPQASQGSCRPSGIYRFASLRELVDFQARLTGERVVLDIGSVRLVTLSRASSRSSTQFSGARLQIWHEAEGRPGGTRAASADVASFVTAGTALSGPLRERLVAGSSRLVVFLGRSGGFVSCFITDDLEIKADGPTLVKLKPRKGPTPFSRKGSRWQWVKAHLEASRGSEPAGLDIHGKAVEVDIGSDYDSYKTFEIEFESSPSQDNFIRKWDEVMRERRAQRARLKEIQEDMKASVFTGVQARGVFM